MGQRKITQWINQNFNATLTDSDYNHVKDFLLLWNLYESRLFQEKFTIDKAERLIENRINRNRLNHSSFSSILTYFQGRYTKSGIIIYPIFENLNFRPNDREQFVQSTLLNNNPSLKDKILTSAIIIYRFRNNLFHGVKDITQINYQKSNFLHANEFIMRMLES